MPKKLHYLCNDEAKLFSSVYQEFTAEIQENISLVLTNLTPSQEIKIPGKRWLLSRSHDYFGSLLEVHCKHFRYGSVLMLRNCDHIKAISSLLGRQHSHSSVAPATSTPEKEDIKEKIEIVSLYLNKHMHQQAKDLVVSYQDSPNKYRSLKIKDLVRSLDPVLVNFIKAITCPVKSRKRNLFQDPESLDTRNIRQLYSLCVLLFCTNSKLPTWNLVRIMNSNYQLCYTSTNTAIIVCVYRM